MNLLVLILAVAAGLALGGLIWWVNRSLLGAICACVALVGLVAVLLPWNPDRAERTSRPRRPAPAPREPESVKPSLAKLEPYRPVEVSSDGYVGAEACRECHEENHASWHASYHRKMTQVATPEAVLGDFDDVYLNHDGREYRLQRTEDICLVDMPDLTVNDPDAERVSAPIVMTTGSHHMQAYWFATGLGRMTGILPLVHWNETQEWIPRSAAFLKSQGVETYETGRWNNECSRCHSTHRRGRLDETAGWDTHVAEFGISCEACHGPGEQHIGYQRRTKDDQGLADQHDSIVNPASLSKTRSAQVCGQCHAVISAKEDLDKLNAYGHSYRPGDDLHKTHTIWTRDSPEHIDAYKEFGYSDLETSLNRTYYVDGMIRVAGREYIGLINSGCYKNGEMTCLSCHQLHKTESDSRPLLEWANDQLKPEATDDTSCIQCHERDKYSADHPHHQVGSSGSSCYNCHMPHSTYGLLKAIRNHTISSPDVEKDLEAKRPNACNLCHLDKTLEWTGNHLKDWYRIEPPELDKDQREVAASLLWILKGDAGERALVTWSMGWSVAQQTSGIDWQAPFLAQLLDDPYLAIRLIARRSLRTLPGLSDFQLDVVMASVESERHAAIESITKRWHQDSVASRADRRELLIEKEGGVQVGQVERLLEQRDNTLVDLAE